MTLIICLDLKNGISFNNRRQSRDSVVVKRICNLAAKSKLYITEYSKPLFPSDKEYLMVSETSFENVETGDLCFWENDVTNDIIKKAEKLIVYRWDKVYPHDKSFNINTNKWKLISTEIFKGSSHDKIIEEVYMR